MPADLEQLLHVAAARPVEPFDVAALDRRRGRRSARRRTAGVLTGVAAVALAGAMLVAPSGPDVALGPAEDGGSDGSLDAPADPIELLGIWEVHDAGEEDGTILRLDGVEAVLFRSCGQISGPWRGHDTGLFVQSPNGWSGRCGDADPTPDWLAVAAAFRLDGDERLLLDSAGAIVARLVPGTLDPLPANVWEGYAALPARDDEARRLLGPAQPLPDGLVPADAASLVGRWVPTRALEPDEPIEAYAELLADGTWRGSDGCNGVGGRWRSGRAGAFIATAGMQTRIGCDHVDVATMLTTAARAGIEDGAPVLLDRLGAVTGRFVRSDVPPLARDLLDAPGLVAAATSDGRVVLLDLDSGALVDELPAGGGEAMPALGAAPGGDAVLYDVSSTSALKEIWSAPLDGGRSQKVTDGRRPAVSPDGRRLAYVAGDPVLGDVAVAVRDLASGETQEWPATAGDGEVVDIAALSWAGDSTRLALELTRAVRDDTTVHGPDRFEVRVLETAGDGSLLDSDLLGPAAPGAVWRAPAWRGDRDELAVVELCCDLDERTVEAPTRVRLVSVDVRTGTADVLAELDQLVTAIAADPTGGRLALIATEPKEPGVGGRQDRLLRWDGALHHVADGIARVAWLGASDP